MFGLFGCSGNKRFAIETYRDTAPGTMLVDYYDRTVGTPEEQPYYELVLYTHSDTRLRLEEYTGGGTEDERCTAYLVPLQAGQDAFDVIKKNGMDKWNKKSGTAISGRAYVCKFPDGSGDVERVTSGNMPEDGSRAFGEVMVALRQWCREEYLENKE